MCILHVDDDASFLHVAKMILELESNFNVYTATSVDEAFCKLKTRVETGSLGFETRPHRRYCHLVEGAEPEIALELALAQKSNTVDIGLQ